MIDEIIKMYEAEMSQVLPYKWDWRGSLLAGCACLMVVLCVVVLMLAIAGLP